MQNLVNLLVLCALLFEQVNSSNDANEPQSNLNSLRYPDDSLIEGEVDIYSLTPGLIPSPRVKSTLTYVEPLVVVMGGYNTDGTFLDDIHIYDTRLRKWSGVLLKRACCNYAGEVIERLAATEEEHELDPISLTRVGMQGDLPAARAEHAAAGLDNVVYVFGGATAQYGLSNDFYSFDPIGLQWRVIDRYGGQGPSRRAGHSLVTDYDTTTLVLFGGRATLGEHTVGLADVWTFDVQSRKWEVATARAEAADRMLPAGPAGRQHSACAIAHSTLFVVGGIDPVSKMIFDDVWAFHLGSKTWQRVSGSGGQTAGLAPPPLYHGTLLPVPTPTPSVTNSTNFSKFDLLLFGGVGGGGSCGSAECMQLETSLGQVYRLPVSFDPYELDSSGDYTNQGPQVQAGARTGTEGIAGVGIDGKSSIADVNRWRLRLAETGWMYARLTDDSDDAALHGLPNAFGIDGASGPGGGGALGRGRLLKTWGMESVCFDPQRSLM